LGTSTVTILNNYCSNVAVYANATDVMYGKSITKISAGSQFGIVLSADNKLYGFGQNYGNLGDGTTISTVDPVAVDMSGVLAGVTIVDISASYQSGYFTIALGSNGNVYGW
jgi:hypothetical protein